MTDGKHNELAGEMLPTVKTRSYENLHLSIAPLKAWTLILDFFSIYYTHTAERGDVKHWKFQDAGKQHPLQNINMWSQTDILIHFIWQNRSGDNSEIQKLKQLPGNLKIK